MSRKRALAAGSESLEERQAEAPASSGGASSGCSADPFERLPDELLRKVFGALGPVQTFEVCRLPAVCRRFRALLDGCTAFPEVDLSEEALEAAGAAARKERAAVVSRMAARASAGRVAGVRHLRACLRGGRGPSLLAALAPGSPGLERCELSEPEKGPRPVRPAAELFEDISRFPALRQLSIEFATGASYEWLRAPKEVPARLAARPLPPLVSLHIRVPLGLEPRVAAPLFAALPSLRRVSCYFTAGPGGGLASLRDLAGLEELVAIRSPSGGLAALAAGPAGRSLRSLSLAPGKPGDLLGYSLPPSLLPVLPRFPRLESLRLTVDDTEDYGGVPEALRACGALRRLDLTVGVLGGTGPGAGVPALPALAEGLAGVPSLEELHLTLVAVTESPEDGPAAALVRARSASLRSFRLLPDTLDCPVLGPALAAALAACPALERAEICTRADSSRDLDRHAALAALGPRLALEVRAPLELWPAARARLSLLLPSAQVRTAPLLPTELEPDPAQPAP
eukprot:tig00020563_g11210.t1